MKAKKKRCGTCGWWRQANTIVGECIPEGEGTTFDKVCDINMWKSKEAETQPRERKAK